MRGYLLIIYVCLLWGCTNRHPEKTILPREQMSRVLWDMIQVDELATSQLSKDTTKVAKQERIQLYQKVFQLHKITKEQFSKSFKYYSSHPDLMKVMFDTLEARGVNERKNMFSPKDSLRK